MLFWFFLGSLVGVASDFLWWRARTRIDKYEKRLEVFGTLSLGDHSPCVHENTSEVWRGVPFVCRRGMALILAEITQDHPFAIRSNPQFLSTIIGISLVIVLVLV